MLGETAVAVFLLVCLGTFLSVNIHNIMKFHRRSKAKAFAEVEHPSGLFMSLAAFGTLAYFVGAFAFVSFVFADPSYVLINFPLSFPIPFTLYFQVLGIFLTALGYFVFMWSVIARGSYAVSWEMPEQQKLVTWGPYRYVRHPSYLGYFLMFFGLFLMWPGFFALFPLLAILGYYRLTFSEERLLLQRFGQEYAEYQRRTGRFAPKFR